MSDLRYGIDLLDLPSSYDLFDEQKPVKIIDATVGYRVDIRPKINMG